MAKHDDKIKALLAKVAEQQDDLGTKPKALWSTNGIFKYKDGTSFFNLNTVKDTQVLVEALAYLLGEEQRIKQAADFLGVPSKDLSYNGYSVNEWKTDFKKRVACILWDDKKTKLDATKSKLKSLVSEEAKTEEELNDIESMLQ